MSTAADNLQRRMAPIRPWWLDPPATVAQSLHAAALSIEMAMAPRRVDNSLHYTLVTLRPAPISIGAFMSARATTMSGAFASTTYQRPYTNLIGACDSTFDNRLGTVRPFVQFIPRNGDMDVRASCRLMEDVLAAAFDQFGFYDLLRTVAADARKWGAGVIKIVPSDDGEAVVMERVLVDELLVDEEAARIGKPHYLIQRRFVQRSELVAAFSDGDGKIDPAIENAIRNAPAAFVSPIYGKVSDLVTLLEGWKLPESGGKGRRVLALPNMVLEDEDYDHDTFPFAWNLWEKPSLGLVPKGMAETLAPVQLEINRHDTLIHESQVSAAVPTVLADDNSGLTEKSFANRIGRLLFKRPGTAVEFTTPTAQTPEIYNSRERWIAWGMQLVGLNQQQMSGVKPPGLNAAVALRTQVQIEDARNKGLLQEMESTTKQAAELFVRAAIEVALKVEIGGTSGKTVSFADVDPEAGRVHVYPISSLPSDPAGRVEEIEEQYANGVIDKRTYFRLRQMPDMHAFANLATAADDLIDTVLDEICRTGKYVAPEPYDDLQAALKQAQSRYFLEKRLGSSEKVLAAIQDFMFAVVDLQNGPTTGLPSVAPGMQPPASGPQGVAPSPAAPQLTPPIAEGAPAPNPSPSMGAGLPSAPSAMA